MKRKVNKMSIFEKYTKNINAEELVASQKEINDNASGSGDYKEVPLGTYEVEVSKLECKLSKEKKNPMVSIWFKILEGDYKDSLIFYNGVFYDDWMRHRVVKMLSTLLDDPLHEAEINLILKSNDVNIVNNFCMDVHEAIDGKFEYLLDYGMKKGFNTYDVKEVFEV